MVLFSFWLFWKIEKESSIYLTIKKLEIACNKKQWLAIGCINICKISLNISNIPPTVPKKSRILKTYLVDIICYVDG